MYKEPEYAQSRLKGTIVMSNGKPVYIQHVHNDMTCTVRPDLDSPEENTVHVDELNILGLKLGFVNLGGSALYLSRKPMRNDWRQGLRSSQVVVLGNNGIDRASSGMIMECLKGVFPAKDEALKYILAGVRSIAICRELCLKQGGGDVEIHHSWHGKVGSVVDGLYIFDGGSEHLEVFLEACDD